MTREPKLRCTRCDKELRSNDTVWLSLNNRTGQYVDGPISDPNEDQGAFAFGRRCANLQMSESK